MQLTTLQYLNRYVMQGRHIYLCYVMWQPDWRNSKQYSLKDQHTDLFLLIFDLCASAIIKLYVLTTIQFLSRLQTIKYPIEISNTSHVLFYNLKYP